MKNQTVGQLMSHEEDAQTVWVMGLLCTVRVVATYPVVCGNKNPKRYRFLLPHPNTSRQVRVNKRQIVPTVLFNRPSDTPVLVSTACSAHLSHAHSRHFPRRTANIDSSRAHRFFTSMHIIAESQWNDPSPPWTFTLLAQMWRVRIGTDQIGRAHV